MASKRPPVRNERRAEPGAATDLGAHEPRPPAPREDAGTRLFHCRVKPRQIALGGLAALGANPPQTRLEITVSAHVASAAFWRRLRQSGAA